MRSGWIFLVTTLLVSCGGGDGSAPADQPDGGANEDAAAGKRDGFDVASAMAERDADLEVLFYTAARDDLRLTVDFYFSLGATDGPHQVEFSGEGLFSCATCVLIRSGCGEIICETSYMAQSGSLEISAMGDFGEGFIGQLSGVVFAEVEIDAGTQQTTVVPGGKSWCIEQLELSATVQ